MVSSGLALWLVQTKRCFPFMLYITVLYQQLFINIMIQMKRFTTKYSVIKYIWISSQPEEQSCSHSQTSFSTPPSNPIYPTVCSNGKQPFQLNSHVPMFVETAFTVKAAYIDSITNVHFNHTVAQLFSAMCWMEQLYRTQQICIQ